MTAPLYEAIVAAAAAAIATILFHRLKLQSLTCARIVNEVLLANQGIPASHHTG